MEKLKIITGHPWLVTLFIIIISSLLVFVELPLFLYLILFITLALLARLSLIETFKKYGIDLPIFFHGSFVFAGIIIAAIVAIYFLIRLVIMLVIG